MHQRDPVDPLEPLDLWEQFNPYISFTIWYLAISFVTVLGYFSKNIITYNELMHQLKLIKNAHIFFGKFKIQISKLLQYRFFKFFYHRCLNESRLNILIHQ